MAPQPRALGASCLVPRRESLSLSGRVLDTINESRAPSTRRLYSLKWSVFSAWCSARSADPTSCDVPMILSFLQEMMDGGRSPSTLKVYVAAISAFHEPTSFGSVGRHELIIRFLRGARRLRPPRPPTVPPWDLSTVLSALKAEPFEPLASAELRVLTLKAVLLLALASVKRVGDLQALSVSPSCLEFGSDHSVLILKPHVGYVPKVLSTPFRAQVITLSALRSSEQDPDCNLLCPVRAIRMYIERSAAFRQSDQLFVCFGDRTLGSPVTKQRLARWLVEAIALAYSSSGLPCPLGIRAHSTRGVASSWAWSSGVSLTDICTAAGWASPSTFVRFYKLDVPTLHTRVLAI